VVGGAVGEHVERVGDHRVERAERVAHPARRPREVDDERAAARARHAARQRGARELGPGHAPHVLGDPGRLALEHGARGLGRHVARREPGAAGGEHELGRVPPRVAPGEELAHDGRPLVGHERARGRGAAARGGPRRGGLARGVVALAARAGVGDGEDGDAHRWAEGRSFAALGAAAGAPRAPAVTCGSSA
jgi:hypothetical protein